MNSNSPRKKLYLVLGVGISFIVIMCLTYLIAKNAEEAERKAKGEYYDQYSGETVSAPEDKGPDKYGVDPDKPILLGFTKILEYGVTAEQLDSLQETLHTYVESKKLKTKEISVDVASINKVERNPDSDSTVETIRFTLVFNRENKINAKMNYFDLTVMNLVLTDPKTGATLYESGDISSEEFH